MFEGNFKCLMPLNQLDHSCISSSFYGLVASPIFPPKKSHHPQSTRMVSDDEGAHAAPKRLARAKRADSPVSTVSTAISTAAATVSAVASTATASNTGSEGPGAWVGGGWDDGQKLSRCFYEKSISWDDWD